MEGARDFVAFGNPHGLNGGGGGLSGGLGGLGGGVGLDGGLGGGRSNPWGLATVALSTSASATGSNSPRPSQNSSSAASRLPVGSVAPSSGSGFVEASSEEMIPGLVGGGRGGGGGGTSGGASSAASSGRTTRSVYTALAEEALLGAITPADPEGAFSLSSSPIEIVPMEFQDLEATGGALRMGSAGAFWRLDTSAAAGTTATAGSLGCEARCCVQPAPASSWFFWNKKRHGRFWTVIVAGLATLLALVVAWDVRALLLRTDFARSGGLGIGFGGGRAGPFWRRKDRGCCSYAAAPCLACEAELSVADFCEQVGLAQGVPGCQECCEQETAECRACAAGLSVRSFCADRAHAEVLGCDPALSADGDEGAASCGVVEKGIEYVGGDLISEGHVDSLGACCQLCTKEPKCTSWTFDAPGSDAAGAAGEERCSLKRQAEYQVLPRAGAVSGRPARDAADDFHIRSRSGLCVGLSPVKEQGRADMEADGERRLGGDSSNDGKSHEGRRRALLALEPCRALALGQHWTFERSSGRLASATAPENASAAASGGSAAGGDGEPSDTGAWRCLQAGGDGVVVDGSPVAVGPCVESHDVRRRQRQRWHFDSTTGLLELEGSSLCASRAQEEAGEADEVGGRGRGLELDAPDLAKLQGPAEDESDPAYEGDKGEGRGEGGPEVRLRLCDASSKAQSWSLRSSALLEVGPGAEEASGGAGGGSSGRPEHLPSPAAVEAAAGPVSLFCFSALTSWGFEPALIGQQAHQQRSIFACDGFAVYSDKPLDLGGGGQARVVGGTDFRAEKSSQFGALANTPVFVKVWKQVLEDRLYLSHTWTVKVDADAVFLPERLRSLLKGSAFAGAQAEQGVLLNNCAFGLQGPIEVMSSRALQTYAAGAGRCRGPEQEHVYLQQCLLELGVKQVNEFALLAEELCRTPNWQACQSEHVAFHPFRDAAAYSACQQHAEQADKLLSA